MANSPEILNDPSIQMLARHEQLKAEMSARIALQLMGTKSYEDMSPEERKVCVRALTAQSDTEVELRASLCELGMEYFDVNWSETNPEDKTSMEAQMLVRALGGLVSKNGSLVMIMTAGEHF